MDDTEKSTGLFTAGVSNLSVAQKSQLKEVFKTAQDNDSLMWQTVISFDNRWLEMNGLYDSKANGRNEMNKWGVPFPRYKREPLVDQDGNQVEKREYVGKFKMKSIEACKSRMVHRSTRTKENKYVFIRVYY